MNKRKKECTLRRSVRMWRTRNSSPRLDGLPTVKDTSARAPEESQGRV